MNKKLFLLTLLSIVQSNFCMYVVPKPELVLGADGHEWTQIRRGNPVALVPFFDLVVAWRSDDIPDSDDLSDTGIKLKGYPNHYFGKVSDMFDSLCLQALPHTKIDLRQVELISVRLLTCAEARSWMRSPHTQPSAGTSAELMELNELDIENLIPSERIKYLRSRAFEKCCPEKKASERKDEAVSLLALKKRGGNLVAQCPKEIVHMMIEPLFDAWVHQLQAKKDFGMLPGAGLVFEDKK